MPGDQERLAVLTTELSMLVTMWHPSNDIYVRLTKNMSPLTKYAIGGIFLQVRLLASEVGLLYDENMTRKMPPVEADLLEVWETHLCEEYDRLIVKMSKAEKDASSTEQ